jgi:hypothetical protein
MNGNDSGNLDFIQSLKCSLEKEGSASLDDKLKRQGFCVIDDALPPHVLSQLAEEIFMMEEELKASPNRVASSDDSFLILTKPNVHELTIVQRTKLLIENRGLLKLIATLNSMWDKRLDLVNVFKTSCSTLGSLTCLDQVKVALINKGGCFPCHTDTQVDTGRVLSVTIYLDEDYPDRRSPQQQQQTNDNVPSQQADTESNDGGQLRIYPFDSENGAEPIDVCPYYGRM